MRASSVFYSWFSAAILVFASSGLCNASDIDGIRQSLANRICPRPAATYSLIDTRERCGRPEDQNSTFNGAIAYNKCSDNVEKDNAVISKYNDFIRDNCLGHSGGALRSRTAGGNGSGHNAAPGNAQSATLSDSSQADKKSKEMRLPYTESDCKAVLRNFTGTCSIEKFNWSFIPKSIQDYEHNRHDEYCNKSYKSLAASCGKSSREETDKLFKKYDAVVLDLGDDTVEYYSNKEYEQRNAEALRKNAESSKPEHHVKYEHCVAADHAAGTLIGCTSNTDYQCWSGEGAVECLRGTDNVRKFCSAGYSGVHDSLHNCDGFNED